MDLRFSLINGVDRKAVFPLSYLIHSYLQSHNNIGCIEIRRNEIGFTKGVLFTIGKISYAPYGLECRNGIVCYDESGNFKYPKDNLFTFLVNAIMQLSPGHIVKMP